MLIEQAVFASARSGHAEGYHLVERSPGLSESDARELAQWGPSHDSLAQDGLEGTSCNFFGLESGAYCVSKTCAAGAEYSGRGGAQVQTWCLVVPAAVLARFSNNPFAILRAAATGGAPSEGASQPADRNGRRAPLRLVGSAAAVDHMLLAQLSLAPGAAALAALVEQALSGRRLVVVCPNGEQVLAGLVSCLPLQRRLGISLSTGLKLSPRRPFRLSAAPADSAELRRQARAIGAEVLVLDQIGCQSKTKDSWAETVEVALREFRFSQLSAEIVRRGAPLPTAAAAAGQPSGSEVTGIAWPDHALGVTREAGNCATRRCEPAPAVEKPPGRSDASHDRRAREKAPGGGGRFTHHQAQGAGRQQRETLELVEQLDDLVFDAIAGGAAAFARLAEFWPQAVARLEPAVLAEAREQYLRHAVDVWNRCDGATVPGPEQTGAALDVLCLLFPEAEFG